MWRICACRTATPQALLGRVHHVQVLSLHRRHELAVDEMPVEQSLHFFGPFLKFVDQIRNPIYFSSTWYRKRGSPENFGFYFCLEVQV
jgi:hypothetical protein